jgi:hypothetical protein
VADIFRRHGQAYRDSHALTSEQRKVMRDIEACRTAVLGGHVDKCAECGYEKEPSYNSCRNRHCPKCQCLRQAAWVEQRMQRILPTGYFHVVFTVPAELRDLALYNRRWFFDQLFRAASQALLQLGSDPDRLGAQIGVTAVLHTWTRTLRFHPHLHCVVTGGGLSPDGKWVGADDKYLFPVEVLAILFRNKLLDALAQAWRAGHLDLQGPCRGLRDKRAFFTLKDQLYRKDWVVYAKRPFAGPQQVFSYLGRYTHRVAISNQRILSVGDDHVRFLTKDGKTTSITPEQFIQRFLLHVLPYRFVKIRHYGLMAPANAKTRLEQARQILRPSVPVPPALALLILTVLTVSGLARPVDWRRHLERLTGIDLHHCPACGAPARWIRIPLPGTPGSDSS